MDALLGWLWKLIGGWIPNGSKPFPEWLGKVLWAVGICIVVNFAIARLFPVKAVTNIGTGGVQNVYNEQRDTMGIGCNAWRMYVKGGLKAR